ncbi:hypothetical protein [Epilithonimonas lactis]|uniref:Uncharacterized protein n=1 Tax=Epilithonimonas lactis TaxID=421072 RepID=A0A085BMF6_9FLAO|nr:hypothetical protein [Epilithonimonas lactis]KFC23651.1 hypothetical protein IO89_03485 [Epilithonimonas lactis]SEQ20679.1 hypothetical protein SAMN04488097_1665 [Epilithonimonas lactis]
MDVPLKVNNASAVHFNSQSSPSAEASLAVKTKGGYPFIDKLTFHLPENLDIDQILQENPPQFNYCRDRFVYILNLIYTLPSRKKKNIEEYSGFTPISKKILGSTIKDYRAYIKYLVEQNVVKEDKKYIPDIKCGGLRFTEAYGQTLYQKPIVITSWTLIKNITYLRKNYNKGQTQELLFLRKWFSELDVDIRGATKYLKREYRKDKSLLVKYPELRYNSRLLPIAKLHTKEVPLFFVDNTAGRLHTYITQLKSELRKFLTLKGKILHSIDISNSQPFLLQCLLDKEVFDRCNMSEKLDRIQPELNTIMLGVLIESISQEEDVLQYKKIVSSGKFYGEFGALLKENGELDNSLTGTDLKACVKDITFASLFSKNKAIKYSKSIKIFERSFPNVYKVMKYVKKLDHSVLAVVLQNLEAEIVLNKTCKKIHSENTDVRMYTLHDSIITTEENVEYVMNEMAKSLKACIGIEPNFKIEKWV